MLIEARLSRSAIVESRSLGRAVAVVVVLAYVLGAPEVDAATASQEIVPDCQGAKVPESVQASCVQAAGSEATLREAIDAISVRLPADRRAAFAADQAEWWTDVGSACRRYEGETGKEEEPFSTNEREFDCLADRMEMRARVVRALDPSEEPMRLEGEYTTRMGGGYLVISEHVGDAAQFELSVLYGSSNGEIAGELTVSADGRAATFADVEPSESDLLCRLHFTITPLVIEIEEDNCDGWRGAGASFGGSYQRMAAAPKTGEQGAAVPAVPMGQAVHEPPRPATERTLRPLSPASRPLTHRWAVHFPARSSR